MKPEKEYFFDKPRNVKMFIRGFYILCALLLVVDLFIPKHGVFYWEEVPEFFAAYGLVSCILLVLAAKHILRRIVKRKEDYYD